MTWITGMDHAVLLWIQECVRTPVLTAAFRVYTHMGDKGLLWICLTIGLLFMRKTRKTGFLCAGGLIGSLLINNEILKRIVDRPRPFDAFSDIEALVSRPGGDSFPSGHTGAAFAFCWIAFRCLPKRYGIPALILAALMGFSRLYVGVHYPTDVLGGMITGIIIGEIMVRLGRGGLPEFQEERTKDQEERTKEGEWEKKPEA